MLFSQEEIKRVNVIVNTELYISKEDYNFCISINPKLKEDFFYIGDYSKFGDYLNLNLYSEHDFEKH